MTDGVDDRLTLQHLLSVRGGRVETPDSLSPGCNPILSLMVLYHPVGIAVVHVGILHKGIVPVIVFQYIPVPGQKP